jgi:arsenate reductase-like glutaredoxin family protein
MAAITVYWQPGCTSCLKTKEFLRSHGVVFESVNVREDPGPSRS